MDFQQWVTLSASLTALTTPHRSVLAWLTAGICQTCYSTYPFCPNTQGDPEPGQPLCYREINVAMFSILS